MKMIWSPKRDHQFGVLRKKGKQLNYVGKASTHTPGTVHEIPYVFLNRLKKLTPRKAIFNSERVNNVYPDHANTIIEIFHASTVISEVWEMILYYIPYCITC